jgi:hypothetical protein
MHFFQVALPEGAGKNWDKQSGTQLQSDFLGGMLELARVVTTGKQHDGEGVIYTINDDTILRSMRPQVLMSDPKYAQAEYAQAEERVRDIAPLGGSRHRQAGKATKNEHAHIKGRKAGNPY